MDKPRKGPSPLWLSIISAVILVIAHIYVYQVEPLAGAWNDHFLNFLPSVTAGLGAAVATLVWRQFSPTDRPRVIWRYFALGLWIWAIAEVSWGFYMLVLGEVPLFSLTDVFWIAGYYFFGGALLHQYRLVFRSERRREMRYIASALLIVLILSLIGTLIVRWVFPHEKSWLGTFVNVFYPLGDLALALIAVTLARAFGRGLWARPWLAFLAFVFSDSMYTWLAVTGIYAFAAGEGNVVSLVADTAYLVAYMLLGLACHAQLLLLRRGPRQG